MRAVARVNLDAISSNIRVLRARMDVPLMAVPSGLERRY